MRHEFLDVDRIKENIHLIRNIDFKIKDKDMIIFDDKRIVSEVNDYCDWEFLYVFLEENIKKIDFNGVNVILSKYAGLNTKYTAIYFNLGDYTHNMEICCVHLSNGSYIWGDFDNIKKIKFLKLFGMD
jgi:hypothetical protein